MNIVVLGAGMMGQAIAFDLVHNTPKCKLSIVDNNKNALHTTKQFLNNYTVNYQQLDITNKIEIQKLFQNNDIAISAVPYFFNMKLTKLAIQNHTHLIDLGGNNTVVQQQKSLYKKAEKEHVTIIPDSGLAPGLTSVITRHIVEQFDQIDSIKIRVGGLPQKPKPPLNYQLVFSPYGLINEYVEDAIILKKGKIITKPSLTEIEHITFPQPFGTMEAFLTSGGCSTLPYTYQHKIGYLDYKTIRYPGHCILFKTILNLGMANTTPLKINQHQIIPREILIHQLKKNLPINQQDVVLIKIITKGIQNNKLTTKEYTIIDYYDTTHKITAMMRTTGYPVAITAQLINNKTITTPGVFCPEEIVPPQTFLKELTKRNIKLQQNTKTTKR